LSLLFYRLDHNNISLIFLVITIFLGLLALIKHRNNLKEKQFENSPGFLGIEAYVTDEDTALVIKSIGTAENGFIYFGDIVNETNLHLKIINKALDWLVINKLAVENKGRRGKIYELTPKGRDVFRSIINSNIKT
jgi:predicted transcriptional regulator